MDIRSAENGARTAKRHKQPTSEMTRRNFMSMWAAWKRKRAEKGSPISKRPRATETARIPKWLEILLNYRRPLRQNQGHGFDPLLRRGCITSHRAVDKTPLGTPLGLIDFARSTQGRSSLATLG